MSNESASAMDSKEKSPLVPRLRFPEFRGAGDWVEMSLGEIGEIVTGKTPSTSDDSLWNGDIQFVTPTDISEEKYQWSTQRSVVINANTKVLPLHSTMFTCIASIGKMALSVKPCITNQQINTVIPNKDYENEFVYYSLLNIVPLIKGTQANSTLPIINKTEFSKFTIPVPMVHDEQQKIADCLSSLDELITAETQKLDALKTHKKGLMQQLFPREGETLPRLRFPEFRGSGGWEVRELGELCKIRTGKKDANEGCENGLYPFFTCAERHIYSNTYSFDAEAILIAGNANVGQAKYYKGKFEAYQRTYVLTNFAQVSVPYLYLYLSSQLSEALAKQVQTSAMSYIKLPMLETYKVPSPKAPEEQQKIANCLSSLDDLITAQSQKIDTLKTHKKGLMQQLFPVLDEVPA